MEIRAFTARASPERHGPSEKLFTGDLKTQVDWQRPLQPLLACACGGRLGADAPVTSTGLSSLCWLFTVFKVSKEKHGKDEERIGEMKNELRKQQWGERHKRRGKEGKAEVVGRHGSRWRGEGSTGRSVWTILGGPSWISALSGHPVKSESSPRREALPERPLGKDPGWAPCTSWLCWALSPHSPPAPCSQTSSALYAAESVCWLAAGRQGLCAFPEQGVSWNSDSPCLHHATGPRSRASPGCCQRLPWAGQPYGRPRSWGCWRCGAQGPQLPALPQSFAKAGVRQGHPFLPRV